MYNIAALIHVSAFLTPNVKCYHTKQYAIIVCSTWSLVRWQSISRLVAEDLPSQWNKAVIFGSLLISPYAWWRFRHNTRYKMLSDGLESPKISILVRDSLKSMEDATLLCHPNPRNILLDLTMKFCLKVRTVAWMPYTVGDILPTSAVHTGYMTCVRYTYTAQIYRTDCDSVEFSIYVPDDSVAHYPYIGDQFSAIFEIAKVWYGIDICGNEAMEYSTPCSSI